MGTGKKFPGVEARASGLRIYFRWQGKLCRESLGMPANQANMRYASRLVQQIKAEIKAGSFDYGKHFPDSDKATGLPTVRDYVDKWLRVQDHVADSTLRTYSNILRNLLTDNIGNMPIRQVAYSTVAEILADHPWRSMKSRNNALTPIKGVFSLAALDGAIGTDPAAPLKNAKHQKPEPDPLTLDETNAVLAYMAENEDIQTWSYFALAFFSGLRTSELIGLEWPDVDLRRGIIRVQRAQVLGKSKTTKTATARDVELNARSRAALERVKARTYLAGGRVFLDPITNRPYVGDKPPRLKWQKALKALGMRQRAAYQTRHTFASLTLMTGVNPMWVSQQLGHTTMQMTLTRYARWIPDQDAGKQVRVLDAAFGNTVGTNVGTKRGS